MVTTRLLLGCCTVLASLWATFSNSVAGSLSVLHTFNVTDGQFPQGTLVAANGLLYGTTVAGGAFGQGEIFAIDPSNGNLSVIYAFTGGDDGCMPYGGLTIQNGVLYGTASFCGLDQPLGYGTVFSFDTSDSTFTTVYEFTNSSDGCWPAEGISVINGLLYGTTGGCPQSSGAGTLFSIDPGTKSLTTLYTFGQAFGEAAYPNSRLLLLNGKLFGVTVGGGKANRGSLFGYDIQSGTLQTLFSFKRSAGEYPDGGLVSDGTYLYGGTPIGGSLTQGYVPKGAIYKYDLEKHRQTLLYTFSAQSGSAPNNDLLLSGTTLYGTLSASPSNPDRRDVPRSKKGQGALYSFDLPTGKLTILYSFKSSPYVGGNPTSGLTLVNGVFYGVGAYDANGNNGIIYSYTP